MSAVAIECFPMSLVTVHVGHKFAFFYEVTLTTLLLADEGSLMLSNHLSVVLIPSKSYPRTVEGCTLIPCTPILVFHQLASNQQ